VSEEDIEHIIELCNQVIAISEYREQLYEYLKNRMNAIAPNLTIMVGELVGARLIAHAGSLLNLAKHPASTVQILGAEKALFRALKTKHETPKYGLIYHASLIGQTAPKNKGKIARVVAGKAALSSRFDSFGEVSNTSIGMEGRARVERRMKMLETGQSHRLSGKGKGKADHQKYDNKIQNGITKTPQPYPEAADSTIGSAEKQAKREAKKAKKVKAAAKAPSVQGTNDNNNNTEETLETPKKKTKKEKKAKKDDLADNGDTNATFDPKKAKKRQLDEPQPAASPEKKHKNKKKQPKEQD